MALDPILSTLSPRSLEAPRGPSPHKAEVFQDSPLCHQADYWQSRCNDLKKSLNQVKADLAQVSERERRLTLRNSELESRNSGNDALEDEVYHLRRDLADREEELRHLQKEFRVNHSEMRRRLDVAVKNSKSKEDLCENLQLQLRSKVVELDKAKEELHQLRKELSKQQETHHRETAELRSKLEALESIRENFRAKEQDFEQQEELCHQAVSELSRLRLRLKTAQEQEAKQYRMVELLQSEKDLWLDRSSHYKKQYYDSLRQGLDVTLNATATAPATPPTPPATLPWRRFSRASVSQ